MMRKVAETLLGALAARTTGLTRADAKLLIELAGEIWTGLSTRGVVCKKYGRDGTADGHALCIPSRWKDADWAWHDRVCRHCPVFRAALEKRRER